MTTRVYALATKIEEELYEIFHTVHVEQDSKFDVKYKEATLAGAVGIKPIESSGISIGSIYQEGTFLPNEEGSNIDVSDNKTLYVFISDNKVFSAAKIDKDSFTDRKYTAAFGNDVIVIDVSDKDVEEGYTYNIKDKSLKSI
jgi:hypothetical protein